MVQAVVQPARTGEPLLVGNPNPVLLAALMQDMAQLEPSGTPLTRTGVLSELYLVKSAMRTWYDKQPDQIMREASAYSARLTELWTELRILEVNDRAFTQLRTMQVGSVLEEIDRQVGIARSRIAIMRQDLELSK